MKQEVDRFPRDKRIQGTYDRRRFVLSLSDDIHHLLQISDAEKGEVYFSALDSKTAQAFSTYLHETIHWWQHIGASAGFLQTLIYPAVIHLNYERLVKVLHDYGPKKSVLKLLEREQWKLSPSVDNLNVVINNMKDADFFIAAMQSPDNLQYLGQDKYFEGRGHGFLISYIAIMSALSPFDPDFTVLPDPRTWESMLSTRKNERATEYFYGSTIRVPPIGLHALLEGQARFSQMQYLFQASEQKLDWEDFRNAGMLGSIYVEAFELFLLLTATKLPENVLSSAVGLFLLICDLSINPTDGFPLPVRSFDTFVDDVDPGTRFMKLCQCAKDKSTLFSEIKDFSRSEYLKVSEELCDLADFTNPMTALDAIASSTLKSPTLNQIVKEGESLSFENESMALRLLIAKFILFSKDKQSNPEFFCWPGARMTENLPHARATHLFREHQSLFTNRSDKRGIYPRLMTGIDPKNCIKTLTDFYQSTFVYDMTRQWTLEGGVFDLSFDWLTDGDNEVVFQWANKLFHTVFNYRPEDFEVL